jgi:hypothetical protein
VFENRVLRRIFGPMREEMGGGWKSLHNEELQSLYALASVIWVMKSRRMRGVGHVERMGRRKMHKICWLESLKVRDHLKDLDVDRKIILDWILGK